jgi:hypothetical protein
MTATFTIMVQEGSGTLAENPTNGECTSYLDAQIRALYTQLWHVIEGELTDIIKINATINDLASRAAGAARVSILKA